MKFYKKSNSRSRRRFWLFRYIAPHNVIAYTLIICALWFQHYKESGVPNVKVSQSNSVISCDAPKITDGDTFRCNGYRIRLAAIDTPEMPGHCRKGRICTPGDPYKAKSYLEVLTRGPVSCQPIEVDHYGRTIANCMARGRNLSCEMVSAGHAVERYGKLSCH